MNKDLNYYLNLTWSFKFEWDPVDNIYVATVTEIPGCMSHGSTFNEAVQNIKEALQLHISVMLKKALEVPEPAKLQEYKGNIAYRTTPQRHYKIAKRAHLEGKSLSKFLDELIDREVA